MELVTYLSIGAVAALVGNAVLELLTKWYFSEPVQQVVNMTLMVRDSLPPMIVEGIKQIAIVVGKVLHLVIHVVAQGVIAVKNILKALVVLVKGLYVTLRGFNEAFDAVWSVVVDLPNQIANQLTVWIYTPPVSSMRWTTVMLGFVLIFYTTILVKRCLFRFVLKKKEE